MSSTDQSAAHGAGPSYNPKFADLFSSASLPSDETLKQVVRSLSERELMELARELSLHQCVEDGIKGRELFLSHQSSEAVSRRGCLQVLINIGIAGFTLNRLGPRLLNEDIEGSETKAAHSDKRRSAPAAPVEKNSPHGRPESAAQPNGAAWAWKRGISETLTGTAWETVLGMLAMGSTNYLIQSLGIKTGNTGVITALSAQPSKESLEKLLKKIEADPDLPTRIFADVFAKKPAMEEFFFRLAPSLLLRLGSGNHWEVGLPATALFALVHMIVPREMSVRGIPLPFDRSLETTYLPVPQFLLGLVFWHLNQRYGFIPVLAAHMANNFLPAVAIAAGTAGVPLKVHMTTLAQLERLKDLAGVVRPQPAPNPQ